LICDKLTETAKTEWVWLCSNKTLLTKKKSLDLQDVRSAAPLAIQNEVIWIN
jgi:hypothetical protein